MLSTLKWTLEAGFFTTHNKDNLKSRIFQEAYICKKQAAWIQHYIPWCGRKKHLSKAIIGNFSVDFTVAHSVCTGNADIVVDQLPGIPLGAVNPPSIRLERI